MMKHVLFLLALSVTSVALARTPQGDLDLLLAPHNGMPVIVMPGQQFDAILATQAEVRLEAGPRPLDLVTAAHSIPDGRVRITCTVPSDAPPATYTLAAQAGGRTDRNVRAVTIVPAFPKTYTFAHLTDTHVGSNRHPRTAKAIVADVIRDVNQSGAAFALVTGDLTDGGDPAQFRSFIEILDTCRVPTFVCAGNHDRRALNYEQVLSPLTYCFRFGQDGYLSFDTKDFVVADELGPQDAALQVFRCAIKPSRWSIGFSHRYEPDMGMRAQLTLFVDDPLDHFFYGHTHRANLPGQDRVPWGTTPITITPAAINGVIRYVDITPDKIAPRTPQRVADVQ